MRFSYDMEKDWSEDEEKANQNLKVIMTELKDDNYNAIVHNFFKNFVSI